MAKVPAPSRGEIWLVDFDPAVGFEIQKLRPAIVVNLDSIGRLPLRIIVPVTDWKPQFASFPWFVFVAADGTNGLAKDSGVDCFQVKSLSLLRFSHRIGSITTAQIDAVASAIALCVGAP
jgi:mRNA interferase MazF